MSRSTTAVVGILFVLVLGGLVNVQSRTPIDIAEVPSTPTEAPISPEPEPTFEAIDMLTGERSQRIGYPKGDASIEGIVVDKQGKPLAGMVVIHSGDILAKPFPRTLTSVDGKFLITNLAPMKYRIMAVPPISGGFGIDSGSQKVELAAGQALTGLPLVYDSDQVISGRVTNSKGEPIVGATVRGNQDGTSSIAFNSWTETGPDGRYNLESSSRRTCSVWTTHSEYSTVHLSGVERSEKNVDFILEERVAGG